MSSEKKEKKQHKMNFNIKEKLKKTFSKEHLKEVFTGEEQKKHLKQTSFLHTKHHIGSKLMTSPFHLILIRKIYQEIKQAQRYHI